MAIVAWGGEGAGWAAGLKAEASVAHSWQSRTYGQPGGDDDSGADNFQTARVSPTPLLFGNGRALFCHGVFKIRQ